jgi:hypothetical protein
MESELIEHGACPGCGEEIELKLWKGTHNGMPCQFWLGYCKKCQAFRRSPDLEITS